MNCIRATYAANQRVDLWHFSLGPSHTILLPEMERRHHTLDERKGEALPLALSSSYTSSTEHYEL